ncbi:hypothetical protein ACROYT_G010904 [Oculina patagonica]
MTVDFMLSKYSMSEIEEESGNRDGYESPGLEKKVFSTSTLQWRSPALMQLSFLCKNLIFVNKLLKGNCKRTTLGLSCEVGRRQRTFHILSGSVLSVWSKVESVLAGQPGANSKVQIVRCKKSDGSRIVGCLIPSNCVPALTRALNINAQQEPILIV